MIRITTLEVAGFEPAIKACRNPLDSWAKSDSKTDAESGFIIGDADRDLSIRLQKAGPEHAKHLRMVMVWANIEAPLYWWKEFDTYRAGVEKLSCSTMHTVTRKPFTADMFSENVSLDTILKLESIRKSWVESDDPAFRRQAWEFIIENLPSGFVQKRTVTMSYAAVRNIYRQREGHKLAEWQAFRKWAEGLPEGWMITE